jgi:hypothetical protein
MSLELKSKIMYWINPLDGLPGINRDIVIYTTMGTFCVVSFDPENCRVTVNGCITYKDEENLYNILYWAYKSDMYIQEAK